MTPEIIYLVWSAALTLGTGRHRRQRGPTASRSANVAGNREGLPEMTGWAGRARAPTVTCWKT